MGLIRIAVKLAVLGLLVLGLVVGCAALVKASDLAVGDSIALGTGHALGVSTYGRVGAGSCEIARRVPLAAYDHAVISAGINDEGGCARGVRARVRAQHVVWILPAPINRGRAAVLAAVLAGDRTVSYACAGGCTKSNFHPASYAVVACAVRVAWGEVCRATARKPANKAKHFLTWIASWRRRFGR